MRCLRELNFTTVIKVTKKDLVYDSNYYCIKFLKYLLNNYILVQSFLLYIQNMFIHIRFLYKCIEYIDRFRKHANQNVQYVLRYITLSSIYLEKKNISLFKSNNVLIYLIISYISILQKVLMLLMLLKSRWMLMCLKLYCIVLYS